MEPMPMVSIIVPIYQLRPSVEQGLRRCLGLPYPNFEVLAVVDKTESHLQLPALRVVSTGIDRTGPAEKRDLGLRHAKGEIVAFIDDDAYPKSDWLEKAVQHFRDEAVASICGPGLPPPGQPWAQQVTAAVLSSIAGTGMFAYRYSCRPARTVDDYPAFNLFVLKTALEQVGGFASRFYGGEDTKLCLALVKRFAKIRYHPDTVVYHATRSFPMPYLRQIWNYGKHRGYFVKRFPETSRRFHFFLPLLGTLGLAGAVGWVARHPVLWPQCGAGVLVGLGLAWAISWWRMRSLAVASAFPLAVLATHVTYGLGFLRGLLVRRLDV